jgi:Domain of unknown function (DUF5666)
MYVSQRHLHRGGLFFLLMFFVSVGNAEAQSSGVQSQGQDQTSTPTDGNRQGSTGPMGGRGTIGKITSISSGSLEITKPDGTKIAVKISADTEFRKDRQPAKSQDFKVGDFVMVRGSENADHSVSAQLVAGRSGNGPGRGDGRFGGRGGPNGGPGNGAGPIGKIGEDFVAGEVKSVEPPKLTVLRTDNVTQTVELNEETSLRRGRDSITMADIHPGDHVFIHGASQNNAFVPKTAMVLSPEQWERMRQMRNGTQGPNSNALANPPAANPPASAPQQP